MNSKNANSNIYAMIQLQVVAGSLLLGRHQGIRLRVWLRMPQVLLLPEQGESARTLPDVATRQTQGCHRLL